MGKNTLSEPLVSIMLPCFNAAHSLPMALGSLRSQTYQNWEAIVVDDGSTDETTEVLDAVQDPRVRVFRFPHNLGRGAARQKALDEAEGDFLCFLDADDWYFPDKLRVQLDLFKQYPQASIQSCEAVIIDADAQAVGMTPRTSLAQGQSRLCFYKRLAPLPLLFPPAMVRMDVAKRGRFNAKLLRSQDSDYMLQIMHEQRYVHTCLPLYAYSQALSASGSKTLKGYRYRVQCYAGYVSEHPVRASYWIAKTAVKAMVYAAAMTVGQERRFIERRWSAPSEDILQHYQNVLQDVLPSGAV